MLRSGYALLVLGFVALLLSRGRDGFDRGLFQGICVASMIMSAYFLGTATFRRATEDDLGEDAWLPSRDER